MKKTKTTTLKEVIQPFRDVIKRDKDIPYFNPNKILNEKLKNNIMQYYPIVKASNKDYKDQLKWFNDLVSKFGLDDVSPEVFNKYIKEYNTETEENPQKYRSDITKLRNELKSITESGKETESETETETKKRRSFIDQAIAKVPKNYLTKVANDYNNSIKDFKLGKAYEYSSEFKKNGEPYAHRVEYLKGCKENFENNIDAIIKPTVIASVVGSVTDESVGDILLNDVINNISTIPDLNTNNEFLDVKESLNDVLTIVDKNFPETDVKVETVEVEKPKLAPKLEIESLPDIKGVKPTPLQSLGINVDLIKPYKPNLQDHSEILFEQSNVKPDEESVMNDTDIENEENEDADTEEESDSPFSINPITPDQSEEESVISDAMNTPEAPKSTEFVSPESYLEGLKDYLENVNARYLDFKQAFIDSGIITEDNLKELAGVPSIIEKLRRDFSDSTKQLTKDVVQDWNDKLKYIKDLITKHGATMQKQYRLEAKLNAVDVKTEELMKELKANSTLNYLLKLPTSTYEKLPDSIKKACELYREKQNELNNHIASRKKLIPKRAMNKEISKPISSNVLNPMLKRGYQVFQ